VGFASPSSFRHPFLQCQQLIVQAGAGKQVLNRSDLQALPHVKVTVSEYGFFSSATELSIDANTNVASPSVVSGSQPRRSLSTSEAMGLRFRSWCRDSFTAQP